MSSKRRRREEPTTFPDKKKGTHNNEATFNNWMVKDEEPDSPTTNGFDCNPKKIKSSNYWRNIKSKAHTKTTNDNSTPRIKMEASSTNDDDVEDDDDISISASASNPEEEEQEQAVQEENDTVQNIPSDKSKRKKYTRRQPPPQTSSTKGKKMSVFKTAKPRCKVSKYCPKNPITGKLERMTMESAVAFVARLEEEEKRALQTPRQARSFRQKVFRAKGLIEYNSLTPQQRWDMMNKYFDDPQLGNQDVDKTRIHFAKERGWTDGLTGMRQWMKARTELGLVTAEVVNYRPDFNRPAFDHDLIMSTLREKLAAVENDFSRVDFLHLTGELVVPLADVEKAIKLDGEFVAKYDEWKTRVALEREIDSEARRSLIIGYFLWQARGSYRDRRNECVRYFRRISRRGLKTVVASTIDRFMLTGSIRGKFRLQGINWDHHYEGGKRASSFISSRLLDLENDQQHFMRMLQECQDEHDAGMQNYVAKKLNLPNDAVANANDDAADDIKASSSAVIVVKRIEKLENEIWRLQRRAATAEKALAAATAAGANGNAGDNAASLPSSSAVGDAKRMETLERENWLLQRRAAKAENALAAATAAISNDAAGDKASSLSSSSPVDVVKRMEKLENEIWRLQRRAAKAEKALAAATAGGADPSSASDV